MARAEDRVRAAGYEPNALGENVGVGKSTGAEIVSAWLASDNHCRVLMHPGFTDVGVGYAFGPYDTGTSAGVIQASYWTQDFASPAPSAPDAGVDASADAGVSASTDAGADALGRGP